MMEFLAFCGVVSLFLFVVAFGAVIVAMIHDRIDGWKRDIEIKTDKQADSHWRETCVGLGLAKHTENTGEWRWKTDAELLAHLQSKTQKPGKK
jgi:hypothetical protein